MGEDLDKINELLDYLFTFGPFWVYAIIFIACFIENLFPPFPGDTFIIGAGALTAFGRLDFVLSFLLIIIGGMLSVLLLYLLGDKYGRNYFIRKNYRYLSAADIENVELKFKKYGAVILIGSRFIVGVRAVLALVAGISKYNLGKMFIFSTISYILFSGLIMYASYKLVEHIETLEGYIKTYNMIFFPLLIIVLSFLIINKIRKVKEGR